MIHHYRTHVPSWLRTGFPAVVALIWAGASAAAALHGPFRPSWVHRAGHLDLADYVRTHSDICGLATSDQTAPVFGQAFIGRPIPFYLTVTQDEIGKLAPYVNALALSETEKAPLGYQSSQCWRDGYLDVSGRHAAPRICLYRRTGACAANAPAATDIWPPSALQFRRFAVTPPKTASGR